MLSSGVFVLHGSSSFDNFKQWITGNKKKSNEIFEIVKKEVHDLLTGKHYFKLILFIFMFVFSIFALIISIFFVFKIILEHVFMKNIELVVFHFKDIFSLLFTAIKDIFSLFFVTFKDILSIIVAPSLLIPVFLAIGVIYFKNDIKKIFPSEDLKKKTNEALKKNISNQEKDNHSLVHKAIAGGVGIIASIFGIQLIEEQTSN